jgi:hypothetical protein
MPNQNGGSSKEAWDTSRARAESQVILDQRAIAHRRLKARSEPEIEVSRLPWCGSGPYAHACFSLNENTHLEVTNFRRAAMNPSVLTPNGRLVAQWSTRDGADAREIKKTLQEFSNGILPERQHAAFAGGG